MDIVYRLSRLAWAARRWRLRLLADRRRPFMSDASAALISKPASSSRWTPCRSLAAENIRDLQLGTGHRRGRYAGGCSFSPISGFLPGFFLGFLRGCDSRSSGLLMFAIISKRGNDTNRCVHDLFHVYLDG